MKLRALCYLAMLSLFSSGFANAKSPPPGTGKADMPANILFLVDTSGSMGARVQSVSSAADDVDVDSKGFVYAVNRNANSLTKFSSSGSAVWTLGGNGSGDSNFSYPRGISIDANDNIYVADYLNRRISVFDSDGNFKRKWILPNSRYPLSVAVDEQLGYVYVSDSYNYLYRYTLAGQLVSSRRVASMYDMSVFAGRLYGVTSSNVYSCDQNFYCRSYYVGSGLTGIAASSNGVLAVRSRGSYYLPYSGNSSQGLLNRTGYRYRYSSTFSYVKGLGVDSRGSIFSAHSGYYYYDGVKRWSYNGYSNFGQVVGSTASENRLDQIKKVIKRLVSDSEMATAANFGLVDWNSYVGRQIPPIYVTPSGGSQINSSIDRLRPSGGTYADRAMRWAESYFSGPNSPIKNGADCQKTFVILLSDGGFSDGTRSATTAQRLLSNYGIQTFVVGFNSGVQSTYAALARAGGTDSPLYANSWQQLYDTLGSAIRQAIASNISFSTPLILPAQSGGKDQILQPQFTYKASNQWEGHLNKYQLNADGTVGALVWDAGKLLDKKRAADRNIWSALRWAGVSDGLNNFVESNLNGLKTGLYAGAPWPTDSEAKKLIRHTRGIDAYDEDGDRSYTDERWKLADIYHGNPVLVGSPSAPVTSISSALNTESYFRYSKNYAAFAKTKRKEVVYAPANDGMLHAFNAVTGEELWAFIPPNVLPKLRDKASSKPGTSNAIYAVDGTPTVKDIFVNNKWQTILIGGLGRGGNGYYALDITDEDRPTFLFAFSNYPLERIVRYVGPDGALKQFSYNSVPAEFDFTKLGEAWSTPQVFLMPYMGGIKWVATFGAGFNGGIDANLGSAVYVIDLENGGEILRRIDLLDKTGGVANSVPSTISLITADTSSQADYKGAIAYVTDLESKLWKINLSDKGTPFEVVQLFDGEGNGVNQRLSFYGPSLSVDSQGTVWAYYGTGNQLRLQHMDNNISNRIFGIKDADFPRFSGSTVKNYRSLTNTTQSGSTCPTPGASGWFNDLAKHEKVTGRTVVNNETLFVSRYIPNNSNLCSPGAGRLSEHDFQCGGVYSGGLHELGAGIPTGAVVYKNKIYVGSSSTSDKSLDSGWIKTDNVIVGSSVKSAAEASAVKIESWRERF